MEESDILETMAEASTAGDDHKGSGRGGGVEAELDEGAKSKRRRRRESSSGGDGPFWERSLRRNMIEARKTGITDEHPDPRAARRYSEWGRVSHG